MTTQTLTLARKTETPSLSEIMERHWAETLPAREAFFDERLAVYIARFGKDCRLARDNANADTRMRFRVPEFGLAVISLFNAARNGGADFVIGGSQP